VRWQTSARAIHGVAREQAQGGGKPAHLINTIPREPGAGRDLEPELVYSEALREYYTAQFRRVIARSHPALMTSYPRVNGVPTSASVYSMHMLAR
jgi:hypothetical protein